MGSRGRKEMRNSLPECVVETMDERVVYEALKDVMELDCFPDYLHRSVRDYRETTFAEFIGCLPDDIQECYVEKALMAAHDYWRSQPEVLKLIGSDDCCNCLNIFARLELAGPWIFLAWARLFKLLFETAGFRFNGTYSGWSHPTKMEFGGQLSWMDDVDCLMMPMFKDIFVRMRRHFVEETGLVGKRDLYEYVTSVNNDVLGLKLPSDGSPRQASQRGYVHNLLYYDWEENIAFRLTRQIILANGGTSPIDW